MARPELKTSLCELLGIEYPILLAGMGSRGKATPAELVAAVSEAGGMGCIGGSGLAPEVIRNVIRKVRTLTRKPFGVDLLLPASLAEAAKTRSEVRSQLREKFPKHVEFIRKLLQEQNVPELEVDNEVVISDQLIEAQLKVLFEEKVPMFAAGLGDPSGMVPRARAQGMKVLGLAGTVSNAKRQAQAGVDVIVAQGYEAGGHTGKIANFPLIPQVVDAVKPIPVVAAGGISDGRGIAAALALGATGVWVGTAFLVADECQIANAMKDQIVKGRSQDFEIQRFYTGKTMRCFKNAVVEAWNKSGLEPLPMPYQKILMDDWNEAVAKAGRWDLHSNPAGQGAGMLTKRKPARQIMDELVAGTIRALRDLHGTVKIA
ncbi:MAG: nitronate monooxygenase [Betaproteobacteria bacterium]|nr:nitronate monooxygenase [Betaproteobacteria bacterium]